MVFVLRRMKGFLFTLRLEKNAYAFFPYVRHIGQVIQVRHLKAPI